MDLHLLNFLNFGTHHHYPLNLSFERFIYATILLWLFHTSSSHSNGNSVKAAVAITRMNGTVKSSSYYDDDSSSYQQIPAPRPFLTGFDSVEACDGCRLGENGEMCSGPDRGECDCSTRNAICYCKDGWTGDACQYMISKITCEKMRHCILCQVHNSGPFSEGNDCKYFCQRNYPTPVIVKTLHFQDDEYLCSFIHHREAPNSLDESPQECRYFFKYGPLDLNGLLDSAKFYIVAQQDMSCGKRVKFPPLRKSSLNLNRINNESYHIFAKSYEETVRLSNDELEKEVMKKNRFITVVIVFVFIALPFVTCVFSLLYNFSSLPCGLCNVFRQSSSKYLRNVRPFPGFVPEDGDLVTYL